MPKLFIKVEVDETLKSKVTKLAKSRNQTEAKLLRSLVMAELDKESPSEKNDDVLIGNAITQRINLRVAAFILDAARERAESKSMSVSRFISSLLKTHLLRIPVMTDRELEVIAESNRELIAIGRNLNQVAYALNASLRRDRDVPLHILNPEVVTMVRAEVLENRRVIRELRRVSLNAWEKSDGDN